MKKILNVVWKLCFGLSTWVRSLLQLILVMYQMLSIAGFEYFACRSYGGPGSAAVLSSATDVFCGSAEYDSFKGVFVAACVFAVLAPIVLGIILLILRVSNKL
jgi:hypothetical protein